VPEQIVFARGYRARKVHKYTSRSGGYVIYQVLKLSAVKILKGSEIGLKAQLSAQAGWNFRFVCAIGSTRAFILIARAKLVSGRKRRQNYARPQLVMGAKQYSFQ